MTHIPKNRYCSVCNQAKMHKSPGYNTDSLQPIEATSFVDHIPADHVMSSRENDSVVEEARRVLVNKDVATAFMYVYPSALKDAEECQTTLQHFVSSSDKVGVFYSDNAKELERASKSLGWRHKRSKDYVHHSNSVVERAVRATSEGAHAICFKLAYLMCVGRKHLSMPALRSTSPIQLNGIESEKL